MKAWHQLILPLLIGVSPVWAGTAANQAKPGHLAPGGVAVVGAGLETPPLSSDFLLHGAPQLAPGEVAAPGILSEVATSGLGPASPLLAAETPPALELGAIPQDEVAREFGPGANVVVSIDPQAARRGDAGANVVFQVSGQGDFLAGGAALADEPGDSLQAVRGQPNKLRERFRVLADTFGLQHVPGLTHGRDIASRVLAGLADDLVAMTAEVPHEGHVYEHFLGKAAAALDGWADHVDEGRVMPAPKLRLQESDPPVEPTERPIRLNLYAVAGDPIQLGHLLIGLMGADQFAADVTAWVAAGDDPRKPHITPVAQRHPMIEAVLARFAPIFALSRIAVGTSFDGETNLFRIFALNPKQPIIATYLVGDDHYHAINPRSQKPDTLPKLEANMADLSLGHDPAIHKVEVAFIRRENHPHVVPTTLPVHWLDHVGFEASSSMIRNEGIYWLMHYVSFRMALALGLYGLATWLGKPK